MSDRVDAFAHIFPESLYDRMLHVHPTDELLAFEGASHLWDVDRRLADMDEFGIDKQVLTLARPSIWLGIDADDALALTRVANDEVNRIAAEHPDRFIPVATLPRLDPTFRDEFDRCLDDLGMAGIQLFSTAAGRPLDDDEFRWVFERAARRDIPIWIHPQLPPWHEWADEFMLHKSLGWPADTSVAMARLVFSGIMAEYPDLAIIVHHMGGMVPHFADRLQITYEIMLGQPEMYPHGVEQLDQPLPEYLGRFYGDTVRAGTTSVLQDGYEFFGADRLVFATDYPFGPDEGREFLDHGIAAVASMDIPARDRDAVFSENLQRLLD